MTCVHHLRGPSQRMLAGPAKTEPLRAGEPSTIPEKKVRPAWRARARHASPLRAESPGELAPVEVVVEAAARQQLLVAALLDDPSVVHDQDGVGAADGRQAVRDHEAGAALPKLGHGLLDQ